MLFLSFFALSGVALSRTIDYDTVVGDFSQYRGGLFQSALDNSTGRLYVTYSIGQNQSDLLGVDPANLNVLEEVRPPLVGNKSAVFSVYGMSLDQVNGRIWATNSREESVGYFHVNDLSVGNEWPANTELGAREVWADEKTGLAYVGSSMSDCVYIYSVDKTDAPVQILNITEKAGTTFFRVMAFSADKEERILYTASLSSKLAAAINLNDYSVKTFELGDVRNPSGVAIDTKRKHLYVSNQRSNNTVVIDTKTGKIIKDITGLGGPLATAYDPLYDVVYIGCRTGHKVVAIDASDFSQIAELGVSTPNHITVGPQGEIYVVDKNQKGALYKFTPVNKTESAGPEHSGTLPSTISKAPISASKQSISSVQAPAQTSGKALPQSARKSGTAAMVVSSSPSHSGSQNTVGLSNRAAAISTHVAIAIVSVALGVFI